VTGAGVEVIDAQNIVTLVKQSAAKMRADETGIACHTRRSVSMFASSSINRT
jgi:hypothetical protein